MAYMFQNTYTITLYMYICTDCANSLVRFGKSLKKSTSFLLRASIFIIPKLLKKLFPCVVVFNVCIILLHVMINFGIYIFHNFPRFHYSQRQLNVQSLFTHELEISFELERHIFKVPA